MTQPSTIYTSPSAFKKVNNQNGYHSKVPETTPKPDMLGKSNDLSSSSALSLHSAVPVIITNNHGTRTASLSTSSSSDSTAGREYIVNPNPKTRERSPSDEKSTLNPSTLTKPHVSTASVQIRPPLQRKPTPHRRRTPPPTPANHSQFQQNNGEVYVDSDNDFEENQHNHIHEIDDENEIEESESFPPYVKPMINRKENPFPSSNQNIKSKLRSNSYRSGIENSSHLHNRPKNSDIESIGLEIIETATIPQRRVTIGNGHLGDQRDNPHRISSIYANCDVTEIPERSGTIPLTSRHLSPLPPPPPPPPAFAKPFLQKQPHSLSDEPQSDEPPHRSLPISNFMLELSALFVVFILCMVLVLAIREDETNLRITMQLVYTYIYIVSISWMIWCTFDIIKFRRQWASLTSSALDNEEYMDMKERHSQTMFYFPDIHNTGGLFMRIGAGLLCMGGLILTVIEIAKTIAGIESNTTTRAVVPDTSLSVIVTKLITYVCRFLFHCVQYTFLFRYGNLIINRYHLVAKIGLIHLVIANFCTWFEAIVIETLHQIHTSPDTPPSTTYPTIITTTAIAINDTTNIPFEFTRGIVFAAAPSGGETNVNQSTLEILTQLELTMADYLYPCLIEYSLISLTVFFIMWKNVGKTEKRSFLRFGDRHLFTINCARASRGLFIGAIIFLLTVLTLIPTYLFEDYATSITHLTGLVLLIVSLLTVCVSYFYTTKLFYDQHAHVDIFDEILILITTVGDFAYALFGLFAFIFLNESMSKLPVGVEISIGFLAIFQTFFQSAFIMDTLKRRTTTKQENRNKPGRETITALLLMNLAIWLHDSLSAKKVKFNPSQVAYYDATTWAIIQAFTSPLSIFYRFHSSVCLADIWQEVYHDNEDHDGTRSGGKNQMLRLVNTNSGHDSQH